MKVLEVSTWTEAEVGEMETEMGGGGDGGGGSEGLLPPQPETPVNRRAKDADKTMRWVAKKRAGDEGRLPDENMTVRLSGINPMPKNRLMPPRES